MPIREPNRTEITTAAVDDARSTTRSAPRSWDDTNMFPAASTTPTAVPQTATSATPTAWARNVAVRIVRRTTVPATAAAIAPPAA